MAQVAETPQDITALMARGLSEENDVALVWEGNAAVLLYIDSEEPTRLAYLHHVLDASGRFIADRGIDVNGSIYMDTGVGLNFAHCFALAHEFAKTWSPPNG